MTRRTVTRRSALKTVAGGTGALAALPWLSEEGLLAFAEVQRKPAPPALRVFSAGEYATVEALAEAIIPADERSPGAREARVADYVDLLLSEGEDALRRQWRDGLASLDAEAASRFGAPFVRLSAIQADTLLGALSASEGAGVASKTPVEQFFAQAKEATIRGYYTSEIGIHKDLHYKGNSILAEFVGCETQDGKDCPHCGQKAEA